MTDITREKIEQWARDWQMAIETYEKYEHIDHLLSDPVWVGDDNPRGQIMYDLWNALKLVIGRHPGKVGEEK